jgi:DNA-binding IclR family transcriptional regulator
LATRSELDYVIAQYCLPEKQKRKSDMVEKSSIIPPLGLPDNGESSDSFLSRAANILSCLSEGIYTLSEIAKRCGYSASTAHRILASLAEPGLVIYDPINHRYYLGSRISKLTHNPVTTHQCLIMVANHEMTRLSALVEETVTLSLMVGIRYLPLHSVYSKHRLIVLEEFTGIRPVEPLGATDMVLMAQLNDKEIRRVLKIDDIWHGKTENNSNDVGFWIKQLARVREEGYSVTYGEKVPGGIGISTPVKNYFCPVSLTVIGPEYRLSPRLPDLIRETVQSAQSLSQILLDVFDSGVDPTSSPA